MVSFVKQKNTITKDSVYLLQLLDAIRFVNKIPDTTVIASCQRLQALLSKLDIQQQQTMVRLSRKYSPSTRALLGALLEYIEINFSLDDLHKSLNPITVYKLAIVASVLSTAPKWNIQ